MAEKVVVEGDVLNEGSTVTVLTRDDDETFEVSREQEAALLGAIAETDCGDIIAANELLARIRRST